MKGKFLTLSFLMTMILMGVWYVLDPGLILIRGATYEVQLSLQLGLLILLGLLFLLFGFLRLVNWFFSLPARWNAWWHFPEKRDGLLALLLSYEAEKQEETLAKQKGLALTLHTNPLFLWISGNAFEKAGKSFEADQCYMELVKEPSTAFLGFKGQIRTALNRRDFASAEILLTKAQNLEPKSPWILNQTLTLQREKDAHHISYESP